MQSLNTKEDKARPKQGLINKALRVAGHNKKNQ